MSPRTRGLLVEGLPAPGPIGGSVHIKSHDAIVIDFLEEAETTPTVAVPVEFELYEQLENRADAPGIGLHAPLSTLRCTPHGILRMTRGRCGSLLLHRNGLAPSTPCRSPGALHKIPFRVLGSL